MLLNGRSSPEWEPVAAAGRFVAWDAVTPDTGLPDRIPRLSRRAIVLGAVGVLVAGAAVATVGFFGAPAPATTEAPQAVVNTQSGQLGTLPLHDEKPMRAIGKGVAAP
jgi:hypothetical protein